MLYLVQAEKGRRVGAQGVVYSVATIVLADNEHAALIRSHDVIEHLQRPIVKPLNGATYPDGYEFVQHPDCPNDPREFDRAGAMAVREMAGTLADQLTGEADQKLKDRVRIGGILYRVKITTRAAVIQFQDLLDAVRFERDEDAGPPGSNDEIYTHELKRADQIAPYCAPARGDITEARGYFQPYRDPAQVIIIDEHQRRRTWGVKNPCLKAKYNNSGDVWRGERQRPNDPYGASRQVWAQMEAEQTRQAIDHIRKWYLDEWEYVGAILDHKDAEGFSVWGYESSDERYLDEVRQEAAAEVASQLEESGYIIEGRPTERAEKIKNARERHAAQMNRQNRDEYEKARAVYRHNRRRQHIENPKTARQRRREAASR